MKHLHNVGLFMLLLALLVAPFAGFSFLDYREMGYGDTQVLSEQDSREDDASEEAVYHDEVNYSFQKYSEEVTEEVLESTSESSFEVTNFNPAFYSPASGGF